MDLSELPSEPFERHPWEEARFAFVLSVVHEAGLDRTPVRVLDAGAGDGWFATQLIERMAVGTEIACWDTAYGMDNTVRPVAASPRLSFSTTRPDGRFDVLLLLDVLEHVEDDRGFLTRLVADAMRPGGTALITVPAWPSLYGPHDASLAHYRRYRPSACAALIRDAGLEIVASGSLFHAALIVRSAIRLVERNRPDSTRPEPLAWRHGALATRLVRGLFALDTRMSVWFSRMRVDVPGLSWWARCAKPS
jgi:2-polyprenyl-3-methyl-5-hydroxy-6-metoxy-1,4-benzoquinol methylase